MRIVSLRSEEMDDIRLDAPGAMERFSHQQFDNDF